MNTRRFIKILPGAEVGRVDKITCEKEGISSLDLMERAAEVWCDHFTGRYGSDNPVLVLCGPGNNGGDGLAIARILNSKGYSVDCALFTYGHTQSEDNIANCDRLAGTSVRFKKYNEYVQGAFQVPYDAVVIDALFGVGLKSPVESSFAELIMDVNECNNRIISVDIPSGLMPENNAGVDRRCIIMADETYTFQAPKLAFLFGENVNYVGYWHILNIGLDKIAINEAAGNWFGITESYIRYAMPNVRLFAHKGVNGRAALIAGRGNMVGAAILASMAAVRSGVGLMNTYLPETGLNALLSRVPEAIPKIFGGTENCFSDITEPDQYNAIAVGPGMGTRQSSIDGLGQLIKNSACKLIIDADAINILSENRDWLRLLNGRAIMTPHIREFERLVGSWSDDYERLTKLTAFASEYGVCVILKDAYTTIALPDGTCLFNNTGNPGLAKGGSGDVLTGVLLGLISSRVPLDVAAVLGVYAHGLTADILISQYGLRGISPFMVAENLGLAWKKMEKNFVKPKW
ncbi:MAG: NAD(P)H-hydrate dehydratase [Marinifilaceae bacterium]|nr:NAD(P)H-hydrate dehydratase [Marinifilaceae bacterium]